LSAHLKRRISCCVQQIYYLFIIQLSQHNNNKQKQASYTYTYQYVQTRTQAIAERPHSQGPDSSANMKTSLTVPANMAATNCYLPPSSLAVIGLPISDFTLLCCCDWTSSI